MNRQPATAARPLRRTLLGAAGVVAAATVLSARGRVAHAQSAQGTSAAPAMTPSRAAGRSPARPPAMMGLSLGMPLEAAVRTVEAMAPPDSVTLPPLRRDTLNIVKIEAPVALKALADDPPRDTNFYLMLNSAPRLLKSQSTRSSHVPFVTLVASADDRRLLRVVFEPAFVHWPRGYDAGGRTAGDLVELLRERHAVPVEQVTGMRAGSVAPSGARARRRPDRDEDGQSWWVLRVHVERKSIVLTDVIRLPDAFASRLQLD